MRAYDERRMIHSPTRTGVTRRLEGWVVWPFSVVSGLIGVVVIGSVFSHGLFGAPFSTAQLVAIGTITGALTYAALRLALRAKTPGTVALATFGAAMLFAALNCPACFTAVSALGGHMGPGDLVGAVFLSAVFGLIYSLPLGALWAVALVGPMYVVAELRQEPTLDGPDRAMRATSGTLAVASLFGMLFAFPFGALPYLLGFIVAVGSLLTLVASVRLHRLGRFLRRVRRGEVSGWEIVSMRDLGELDHVSEDLPSTDLDHHPDAVLMRIVENGGDGAYRTGNASRIAWARTRL